MILHTASEVISFAKELENKSAKLYESLSRKCTRDKDKDTLLSFAKENYKNVVEIERAYYGVITDAIEGCFAFNIEPDEYTFEITSVENMSYASALTRAVAMEEKIIKFYIDAAEQSKALMADVPRAFTRVAKKRDNRPSELRLLLSAGR